MHKRIAVLLLLPACSYAFGTDGGGGAGGSLGSTSGTGTSAPGSSVVSASASQVASSTVIDASASATVEVSSSTGSLPVDLAPCSPPFDFSSDDDAWKVFRFDVFRDAANGWVEATVNNATSRALFGLEPASLGRAPNCFVSMRIVARSQTAVPRALIATPDEVESVRVAFYPSDGTITVLHLADLRTWSAPEPDAFGFARYEGGLYAGYKSSGAWWLVRVPTLPAWFDAATQDARQMFGVGEAQSRSVVMDDYNADPISTADIDAALPWQ